MVRRLTYEDAKCSFESKGYTLLETEYKNNKTKMKYICNKHPDAVQAINLNDIRNNHGCKFCKGDKLSEIYLKPYEEIYEYFKKCGYELLEKDYKNSHTPMLFKCPNHPNETLRMSYNNLSRGTRCKYCSQEKLTALQRNDFDMVKEVFAKNGLEIIQDYYISSGEPIKCKCRNHPDKILYKAYSDVKNGSTCRYCVYERQSGEGNWNWKGGITPLSKYLRTYVDDWKRESLRKFNYKCALTHVNSDDLVVHHSKPFHIIRDEILEKLKIDMRDNIAYYTKEELEFVINELKTHHEDVIGIPLKENVHKLFHKLYGFETTMDDFKEFKHRYDMGEFKEVI